jgi:hypothetical protein
VGGGMGMIYKAYLPSMRGETQNSEKCRKYRKHIKHTYGKPIKYIKHAKQYGTHVEKQQQILNKYGKSPETL